MLIPAAGTRFVLGGLMAAGVDRAALLAHLGITEEDLHDPDAYLPPNPDVDLWRIAEELSGDPDIGLHAAESISLEDSGLFGYLVRSASSGPEALDSLLRYRRLMGDFLPVEAEAQEGQLLLKFAWPADFPVSRTMADFSVGVFVAVGEQLLGTKPPIHKVSFRHAEPENSAEYRRIFPAPVEFGADYDGLLIATGLAPEIPTGDRTLFEILKRRADELIERLPDAEQQGTLSARVREHLVAVLPTADASVERAAKALHMSPRSLRRHLHEEGTSYSQILLELRRDLAVKYLDENRLAVGEIAFLLGFSEASAFHRAFRSWFGRTPAEHRRLRVQTGGDDSGSC